MKLMLVEEYETYVPDSSVCAENDYSLSPRKAAPTQAWRIPTSDTTAANPSADGGKQPPG